MYSICIAPGKLAGLLVLGCQNWTKVNPATDRSNKHENEHQRNIDTLSYQQRRKTTLPTNSKTLLCPRVGGALINVYNYTYIMILCAISIPQCQSHCQRNSATINHVTMQILDTNEAVETGRGC
jgi:hypothetical protein